ncbi:c-type cytochrome [Paraflavitalea sp. CAU 1676]|uniref:c-type cytochrome n=1 Tax=Paraflavitalea sp. CAU 1676 TaxID=3032598 RepID=UPI0023D9FEC4|nr:c-type cytochrome [Paraflavitalea sp. CAU 1676]MDF2190323.1 c-type cytochrome [Paraflavitalea sp. CAU 1676]
MKLTYAILACCVLVGIGIYTVSCNNNEIGKMAKESVPAQVTNLFYLDSTKIPAGQYGEAVRYGRDLMMRTSYLIGPDGVNGRYTNNKMNCTNCHQDGGTKPYSFNLQTSFRRYPEYRAREGRVLSLAERVNNCIMRPHLGKPLPLDGKEMIAFLSYLKWISDTSQVAMNTPGVKGLEITFPDTAANSVTGGQLYISHCARCHGQNGEGVMQPDNVAYVYPPLWGEKSYQPGSSMHRVIKMAQWLVANMPHDSATYLKPLLRADEALDIAAFVNNDAIHNRSKVQEFQYPNLEEKAIDYDRGPFADTFSISQHKYGPFPPIIKHWKAKGKKPAY